MTRIALVLVLSLAVTGPAMACGMAISHRISLGGAIDAIDAPTAEQVAEQRAAQVRRERLAINWAEQPDVRLVSRHRAELQPAVEAVEPGPAPVAVQAQVDATRIDRVRALLSAILDPGPASAGDTADTGDTGQ